MFKLYQPPIDDRLSRIDAFNSDGCLVSQLLHNVPTVSLRVHCFVSSIPPERVLELGHDPGARLTALVVRVDFVNVKVEHGRGLGCLTWAVLSLGCVSPADHHEAITEAEPSHDASVRVVQPSLLSKAECAGQKLQRGSLVGVDKAKLQPFGCWLPLTEVLQWLHEVASRGLRDRPLRSDGNPTVRLRGECRSRRRLPSRGGNARQCRRP